ncbi:hypothetical protein ACWD25_12620 [Streptomyces sp. NPDC002920]
MSGQCHRARRGREGTPTRIAHGQAKAVAEQLYSQATVTVGDIAEVIVFAVERPKQRLAINESLLLPAAQA